LDSAYSHEILGSLLFRGTNGKIYTMTVEGCLSEANPEWVAEILAQDAE